MALPIVQIIHRDGIIDLGWGHPDPTLLAPADVATAAAATIARHGSAALAYSWERGPGPLAEFLCDHLGRIDGRAPHPDELLITGGNSAGLDLTLTLLTRPGDVVLVENPTYHLAVRIMRDHPLTLVPVPADAGGLIPEAVAETAARLAAAGTPARLLYTVPTYHNPTGATASVERRRTLAVIAERHSFTIVEDDVYRELAYDAPPPPSIWSLAPPGTVVRLGSFAKTLAPGMRLGWLTADAAIAQRIAGCGLLDSGGGVNHFTAMVVGELCQSGAYAAQVARLRAAYTARRDALDAALRSALPADFGIRKPNGGFFTWVDLPQRMLAAELLPLAEAEGMAFLPGTKFFTDGGGERALRMAFSLYPPEQLAAAAQRLGAAAQQMEQRS